MTGALGRRRQLTDVSASTRYIRNSDGTLPYESSRNAPQDSVLMFTTSNDGSKASGAATSNSGDPYCSAKNNINYRQFHDLYSTGGYYIEGEHDRMPNHHTYVRQFPSDQTVANVEVFHHQLRDPKCLNEYYGTRFCPDQQYQVLGLVAHVQWPPMTGRPDRSGVACRSTSGSRSGRLSSTGGHLVLAKVVLGAIAALLLVGVGLLAWGVFNPAWDRCADVVDGKTVEHACSDGPARK